MRACMCVCVCMISGYVFDPCSLQHVLLVCVNRQVIWMCVCEIWLGYGGGRVLNELTTGESVVVVVMDYLEVGGGIIHILRNWHSNMVQ